MNPEDDGWTWLHSIARLLHDESFGVEGQDLFIGRRSDDADLPARCIVLTEYVGDVRESFGFDGDISAPNLQVLVRTDADSTTEEDQFTVGRNRAWAIHLRLRRIIDEEIHGVRFIRVGDPSPTPSPLGRDGATRFAWTVDFGVLLG